MPDLRGLILLSVLSALAALLLVAAPASATTQSFANQGQIKIPASGDIGAATPYPSSVVVSGMPGPITDVNVTLHGVGHTFPNDIGVLLVSPSGDTVNVMRGNCGLVDIEDFTWILDQQASTPMPGDSCPEFVYRPNAFNLDDPWPAPAPPGPHATALSAFDGTDPNGEWRLFVQDDSSDRVGFFTNRFQLQIDTKPTITNVKPAPGSKTRDRTPLIAATVLDAQTELAEANIRLFVDGKARSVSYDATTDRLIHQSKKLKFGKHAVKIMANDGVLSTTRSWSFKVIQRR